jgi:hypothetical protein
LRFVAVTIARSVWVTSAVVSALVDAVAPLMAPQLAPAESQRSHWYANFTPFPCQVPVLDVRVFGTRAVPLTEGGVMFFGTSCPGEDGPPEAPAVARTNVRAAEVRAAVMRRLITSLPSYDTPLLVTLKRGSRPMICLFFRRCGAAPALAGRNLAVGVNEDAVKWRPGISPPRTTSGSAITA